LHYDSGSEKTLNTGFTSLGYSPRAIITVIVFGSLALLSLIAVSFIKYRPGIPLVGSCSIAISATCHGQKNGKEAAVEKVGWGVLSVGTDGVGHCGLSKDELSAPVKGAMYI